LPPQNYLGLPTAPLSRCSVSGQLHQGALRFGGYVQKLSATRRKSSLRSALLTQSGIFEPLEQRTMLCSLHLDNPYAPDKLPEFVPALNADGSARVDTGGIVLIDRGTTDNFNSTYGAQANAARDVVDAAFYYWNNVIGRLNQ